MRTLTLRFVMPFLVAFALGCSSSPPAETTTPTQSTTPASSGAETAPTTPATATPSTTPETTAPATTTPEATPPATTHATATPPAQASAETIAAGHRVFNRACGRCHEDNDSEGPSPNKNWEEARMRSQIRQGAGRMRAIPVSRLSDADLDTLIAYLRSTHAVR